MHILLYCNEYPPALCGGIGVFTRLLAEGLAGRGVIVTVAGVYPSAMRDDRTQERGINVVRLRGSRTGRFAPLVDRLRFRSWAEKYIAEQGVDVVEYPDFHTYFLRRHSVPTIVRLHGSNTYYGRFGAMGLSPWNRYFEKRAVRGADHLVAVSRHVLDATLLAMDLERRDRMSVIHNFCDDALFAPVPAAAASPTILFFGTLSRAKGVLQLAEAANRFLAELPDAELQFIGKDAGEGGGRVSELILQTVDPSLRGRVKVLGPMPNSELPARIVSARLCVFPSQEEAFGLTVIEAMACGRPLVASTRGAHRDIVTDGTDGLLADPHDPAALAGAVIRLYRDEGLRRKMGEAARATVQEQFSAARGVEANLSFYRSVIT